ncbi:acyl-CoA dehydrogenase family protein [Aromatoleum anaerobium]|uniref:Acyl-CoA dehydrogenase n=1 Tax=Aromatoleum anaerobium TaxID=182180 RepID=A0ABX1PM85_9RHOO|nr:acyl-CoA dehydrogenase family protein [Aromatoleum anaerobium]MCK0506578.1 acyl-CoA dehydrogenase family protein [Aromatoleum anaerobium]
MNKYLLTDEQLATWDAVRKFAQERIAPFAKEIEDSNEFPREIFREIAEQGYLGAAQSPDYGGAGCDAVTLCLILEELSKASGAVGNSFNTHVSLVTELIGTHGTPAQKDKYLGALIAGRKFGAFGLTEPSGGSNAGAPLTRAVPDGGDWVLSGSKAFITNGPIADIFVVTAKTPNGVSAFIVERGMPGSEVGPPDRKMGMHGSPTSSLYFDEVRVPHANMLGAEGTGFKKFAQALDRGRINVASLIVGLAQASFDAAVAYAREREQFGRPIAAFQGVQFPLAEMATDIEASRLLVLNGARMYDAGLPIKLESSMAKYFAAEAALKICDTSIAIHGGYGYYCDFPVERYFRDVKCYHIAEGTSQIQRLVIARETVGRYPL